MHIDLDVEPSQPVPDREAERPREPERRGHRREYDPREPHREFSDRVDGVVRDVAAFRAVAQADLINVQFDGHSYAGLKGIAEAERAGWIERHKARGPKGGSFTVVVATSAGANRAAPPVGAGRSGGPARMERRGQGVGSGTRVRGLSRGVCGGGADRGSGRARRTGSGRCRTQGARRGARGAGAASGGPDGGGGGALPGGGGTRSPNRTRQGALSGRADRVRERGRAGRALQRRGGVAALRQRHDSLESGGRIPDVRGRQSRGGFRAPGAGVGWRRSRPARRTRRKSGD